MASTLSSIGRRTTGLLLAAGLAAVTVAALPASGDGAEPTAATAAAFREARALLAKSADAFAKVKDYSCVLVKRERLEGELTPDHVIALDVRQSPFSVAMRWQQPKELTGQEAIFVQGKYEGQMRAKPPGLLGAIGYVTVALDDPRVKKTSRHPITSAGLAHLIDRTRKGWDEAQKAGDYVVKVGKFTYAKKKCVRVDLAHGPTVSGKVTFARSVIYFDQANHLPLRLENYGWPEKPGEKPPLVESFSYVNLRLNVGLGDRAFEK